MSPTRKWTFERDGFQQWVGNFLPKLVNHQWQGSLDRACGFYCLAMILDYFELASIDKGDRTRRALRRSATALGLDPMLGDGLSMRSLLDLLKQSRYGDHIEPDIPCRPKQFEEARAYVSRLVSDAKPVVLMYTLRIGFGRVTHYAVAVGSGENAIFLMDPALAGGEGALFNNAIREDEEGTAEDIEGNPVLRFDACVGISRKGFRPDHSELWLPPVANGR